MAMAESYHLSTLQPQSLNGHTSGSGQQVAHANSPEQQVQITASDGANDNADAEAPPNAVTDSRPTRRYQALLLLAGFTMIFQIIGINSTYGIFQEFYTSPGSNIPSAIGQDALVSLAGTIGYGLTWSGSIFVNPCLRKYRNGRHITLFGVILMSLGLVLASFSTKLVHLFLTQALLYGIGASFYYFPLMSLTPLYFDQHRGFAMGLVLSGSGFGGLVFAPVTHALIARVGVRWTLRVLGIWNVIVGIPIALVVRERSGGLGGIRGGGLGLIMRGTFFWQSLGAFLQAAGNLVPAYYMTTYCTSVLNYSSTTASLVLALFNAVNSVSRVGMGVLADKVGRQNTMVVSALLSAISVLALWYSAPRAQFLAFVTLYGIYAGGYNALLPTTLTEVFGVQNYAAANAMIYFIRGMGTLLGAPVAGVMIGSHSRVGATGGTGLSVGELKKRYNDVVLFDGALLMAATACIAYVRWLDARDKGRWKWKA